MDAELLLRRSVERELHDDAQQSLIALAVNLQLARRLVDSDPDELKRLLDELGTDVHNALAGLRGLAWRVYPSVLHERALVDGLRRCAPDAEAAMCLSCAETLARADEPQQATIRVRSTRGSLEVELTVDVELDAVVFAALTDRFRAVGGTVTVAPGSVRYSVPAR
jgi:signal transduction histidine kinase